MEDDLDDEKRNGADDELGNAKDRKNRERWSEVRPEKDEPNKIKKGKRRS